MSVTAPPRQRAPRAKRDDPVVARINASGIRFGVFCYEYLRQYQGTWAGRPLALELWQLEELSNLLQTERDIWIDVRAREAARMLTDPDAFWGRLRKWRKTHVPEGLRVHREALIGIGKKNGKSTFSSGLALYLLVGDNEPGAEVYSTASAKDQARIVFRQAEKMAKSGSQKLLDKIRFYRDAIERRDDGSFYRVLSADAGVQEGINPHGVINDEIHAHKNRFLYDTLRSATIARDQPMLASITTAGFDLDTIGGELYARGAGDRPRVENGKVVPRRDKQRSFYFSWYQADPDKVTKTTVGTDGKPHVTIDLDEVLRANPASWITREKLREESEVPRPFGIFLRYHANIWTAVEEHWLRTGAWAALAGWRGKHPETGELAPPGRRAGEHEINAGDPVVLTVDIGLMHDTSALVMLRPPRLGEADDYEDPIAVRARVWARRGKPNQAPPPAHVHVDGEGPLRLELIKNAILDAAKVFNVLAIAADPYKFETELQELEDLGFVAIRFEQTNAKMVPASEGTYKAIHAGYFAHDGDHVLEAHLENAVARDTGRGWRLDKMKAKKAMDGAVALAIGWSICQLDEVVAGGRPSISVL